MQLLCFLSALFVGCQAFSVVQDNVGCAVRGSSSELRAAAAGAIVRPQSKSSSPRRFSLRESPKQIQEPLQEELWHRLYQRITGRDHSNLLSLQHNEHGCRGVYLNQSAKADDIVLKVPLSNCLRDDCPPSWLCSEEEIVHADNWATRLAACLLDRQRRDDHDLWFSLLPNASFLGASLPIHWSEDIIKSAASTALELSVDASYFVRAAATQDILGSCQHGKFSQRQIENALDIVQTRSCRVDFYGRPLRILAPIFDFINHSHQPNCCFEILYQNDSDDMDGFLVVRALHDIHVGQEITIDYGMASTRPAWKCLSSYGFVPSMTEVDDEEVAEVYIDGRRFEVTPTTIPEELVTAILENEEDLENSSFEFSPSVARTLASRVGKVAFGLLLNPWQSKMMLEDKDILENHDDDDGDDADDTEYDELSTAEEILSSQLAASLRFHQHRVLLACAKGLEEWAIANEEESSYA